jgi:hypothetical protein
MIGKNVPLPYISIRGLCASGVINSWDANATDLR